MQFGREEEEKTPSKDKDQAEQMSPLFVGFSLSLSLSAAAQCLFVQANKGSSWQRSCTHTHTLVQGDLLYLFFSDACE